MNEFKKKLARMNQEQRIATITRMQEQINHKNHTSSVVYAPQHTPQMQMQENKSNVMQEHMQQHNAAEQFKQNEHIAKPQPPLTRPPENRPPVTQPPVHNTPTNNPTQPPVNNPPANNPTQPPNVAPPTHQPSAMAQKP
jgi:hypothetical protein